jgi:hypothetical protein
VKTASLFDEAVEDDKKNALIIIIIIIMLVYTPHMIETKSTK